MLGDHTPEIWIALISTSQWKARGLFFSGAYPLQPHTGPTPHDCFPALQLPATITAYSAVFLWWKDSLSIVLFKVGKGAVLEKAVFLTQCCPQLALRIFELVTLGKKWGHVHQSIATHYPNSQIGIEIQVQIGIFTFKWLLLYHLQ